MCTVLINVITSKKSDHKDIYLSSFFTFSEFFLFLFLVFGFFLISYFFIFKQSPLYSWQRAYFKLFWHLKSKMVYLNLNLNKQIDLSQYLDKKYSRVLPYSRRKSPFHMQIYINILILYLSQLYG